MDCIDGAKAVISEYRGSEALNQHTEFLMNMPYRTATRPESFSDKHETEADLRITDTHSARGRLYAFQRGAMYSYLRLFARLEST
jgi:hypothetical protein